jgi:hypothetical protein
MIALFAGIYFPLGAQGIRAGLRFKEKRGKEHEVPVHSMAKKPSIFGLNALT